MSWAILWLTASASFVFGWAMRSAVGRPMNRRRIILDWGSAHRLLDRAQVCTGEADLTPRVRWLLDQVLTKVGWPAGKPPPSVERHDPRDPMPPDDPDKLPWIPFRIER